MSEVRLKKHAEGVQTNGSSKHTEKKYKRAGKRTLKCSGERTFYFPAQRAAKKESKPVKKDIVPPTDTKEFSSNWKNLLQTLASNPEKEPESDKLPKHVNAKEKQPHKTASLPKDSQKPDKRLHKPTQAVNSAAESSGRTGKGGGPSDGEDSAGHKQFKAEKRKRNEERREKPMNKKMKAEEMEKKTTEPDIWFDDVDLDDIEAALGSEAADIARKRNRILQSDTEKALVKEHAFEGVTPAVAMDCEMVGVGFDGVDSIVARVSLVNRFGKCIYDKYVKPTERVTDYRTDVSGIRPKDIKNGEEVWTVQKEVAEILKGRVLVGHAIHNDLKILLLGHPKKMIRDTQKYKPFQERVKSGRPALRDLCKEILGVQVQKGEHSSVQDAQAAMKLYTLVKKQWEAELKASRFRGREKSPRKPRAPKQQPDRTLISS
ncbi:RNA exonuclease 4 [Triplophysa rosa]|uniref:RNA exonuclease 4 n=1 Tax=Triplophysa rosa TaxID=992332 RepID=A0A9W7WE29_TRIRA|nr:RNA exonuclease 4 [Triplophysa rosa]KAI7795795.1 putative RNA exonuclease 4 [Triplophysa rosa]